MRQWCQLDCQWPNGHIISFHRDATVRGGSMIRATSMRRGEMTYETPERLGLIGSSHN